MRADCYGNRLMRVLRLGILAISAALVSWGQAPVREQVISLEPGWNAVYLEVDPSETAVEAVFQGLPVDQVAAYLRPVSAAQFIENPGADLFRKSGWQVWYAADREDHFLSTLHAVHGPQAYLVHATEAAMWRVRGTVLMNEIRWHADAFNLVGFGLQAGAEPTFEQFFSGSQAHRHNRIYRLEQGAWRQVENPAAEVMRSGEAFWIHAAGSSRYQGPLKVEAPTLRGLLLGSRPEGVVVRSAVGHPVAVTINHVPGASGGLGLAMVMRAVGDTTALVRTVSAAKPLGDWMQALPPLEPGAYVRIPMELRQDGAGGEGAWSLLRVVTDLGTETWVPVLRLPAE